MNGLRLSYIIIRVFCVSVCLCVCLSNLSYLEREVVSPCHLYHLEQLHLVSCTNCFSSLYDAPFERKSLWKFLSVMPDILNGRSYRHAAYTILKSFAWRVVQTALQAYTPRHSREKAFGYFSPVTISIPCTHSNFSASPGQDETYPLLLSLWNILERYTLKDTPSTS